MAIIYKYPIPKVSEPFELKIKGFCEVVHVGIDGNETPCIWAIVAPVGMEETWTYLVVPTGMEFDVGKWCHVKTFQQGQFVWHLLRPVDQWERPADKPESPQGLVYIIATPRTVGLPKITDDDVVGRRFYLTYASAEEARLQIERDTPELAGSYAIFTVHAITQQETTHEVPF